MFVTFVHFPTNPQSATFPSLTVLKGWFVYDAVLSVVLHSYFPTPGSMQSLLPQD